MHLRQVSSETAKVLNFFGKQYLRFWPFFRTLTTSRIVLYSRPSRKPTANHLAKVIMGWLFSMPELLWKNHFDLNTLFPRHCLRHLAKKCSAWQSLSYGRSATLESPCNAAWGVFLYLPMLAQSDLICVATTISMESPSMYVHINLSFIENFFRVEDWRDRCLWHQSFNFFLRFFNIPVWLEKSFKTVFKSSHNVGGFYRPWAFSWLRFSLFLHLHQRWGVGSASATLREIHRVIISLFFRLVASLWPTWQWYQ